ncbi:hypothetical protein B0H63DRAFT_494484 [Podospora didyma]|uniref:Tyrosinase copper-binding domain-containing protein n=1 Tax=Podospora didyma TaxID=330526 RepID=A0AAE0NPZ1_9PEZI|nr:hypothetical protein B0H63DRAFT_494484 [Podospora didyma]
MLCYRRSLADNEKLEHISAVKCIQNLPGKTDSIYPSVRARYDDYTGLHINITDNYHFSAKNAILQGLFHPWYCIYLLTYEEDLRTLCNYTGAQPYWDWTIDAHGFGGNGLPPPGPVPYMTGGGCVTTGPFADLTVNLGPWNSTVYNPRCLTRDFSPWLAARTLNSTVGPGLNLTGLTYHAGGHLAVGGDFGDIGNSYSSPSDPIFFLHHANMDRLWNVWQRGAWAARKEDIAGPMSKDRFVKIRDIMDIKELCYFYKDGYGYSS